MKVAILMRWLAVGLAGAWGVWEGRQSRHNRATSERGRTADRHSFPLIYGVMAAAIAAAAVLGLATVPPERELSARAVAVVGLVLMAGGLAIRLAAMRTLARQFTHRVAILSEHELVRRGLYRWIRHPAYAGQLVFMLGLGVALGGPATMTAAFLPALAVMVLRIRLEEGVLVAHFGDDYRSYARETWRLLPGVW